MIGQEIARQLDPKEWEVLLYDDFSNKFTPLEGYIGRNLFPGHTIHDAIELERPDVISHHAAAVGVGESMYNPLKYVEQNCLFTGELIQAIIDTGWKGRIIHASSMGIFGEQPEPADEFDEQFPSSFYGLTKKFQEDALNMLADTRGWIQVFSLRYFSVYSTTFNPENPFTGIVSIIVDQIMSGDGVELYDDGNQTRDMIHVAEVAEVHNRMISDVDFRKWRHPFLNVCTGVSLTMRDIAEMVCEEFGYTGIILFNGKKRVGDLYSSKGDNSRLMEFFPDMRFRSLKDSIRQYRNFIEANRDKITFGSVKRENENIAARGLVL